MVLLASPPGGSRPNSSLLGDRRMIANVRAERLLKIPAEPSPELRIPGAAAQTRVVSMAGIRLGSWESARAFKGIICDDISEFESHMPSHAVGSLWRETSLVIVDAPNPEAMLAFSVWYSTQHLGRIQSMPAFDPKSFETAIKDATG
jgi:hypothetical protein